MSVRIHGTTGKLSLVLFCVDCASLLNKTLLKTFVSPWLTKRLNLNFLSTHVVGRRSDRRSISSKRVSHNFTAAVTLILCNV